jgi:ubiquinone/menaquinone biosynthesis C-methylase UbiE
VLVDRAKQLYRQHNRQFVLGNAFELPFGDGAFDAAFSVAVLHLLENLPKATQELSRVLKLGGSFLMITANPDAYSAWKKRYTDTKLEGRRFEGTVQLQDQSESREVLYFHALEEIGEALESVGLHIQGIQTFRASPEGEKYFVAIEGRKSTDPTL